MQTTKVTRTPALAGFGSAGKLRHTYCCLPALALFVATLGKLSRGKRAFAVLVLWAAVALPAQTFTTLLSFNGADGGLPSGPLVQGAGGANNGGTIFKISPSGTLTTLYNFCSRKRRFPDHADIGVEEIDIAGRVTARQRTVAHARGSRNANQDIDARSFGSARMAAWGGGFPIKVNGEVVGAIGVSGAPTVQNDIDCARAALALVPGETQ